MTDHPAAPTAPTRRRMAALMLAGGLLALPLTGLPAAGATPIASADARASSWSVVPTSIASSGRFTDIAASSPARAWAVGYEKAGYVEPGVGVLMRWTGSAWTRTMLPSGTRIPQHVAAATNGSAWLTGTRADGGMSLARFDGTRWVSVSYPGATSTTLPGALDTAGSTAYVVAADPATGATDLLRATAGSVTRQKLPRPVGYAQSLHDIAVTPAEDVFLVGERTDSADGWPRALIRQRIGGSWSMISVPDLKGGRLFSVDARSATDVWAVGMWNTDDAPKPLLMHWNGTSWSRVAAPVAAGRAFAVAATTVGRTVWVSAADGSYTGAGTPLYRYDGTRWTLVRGPQIDGQTPSIDALAAVPGSTTVWGAGAASDPEAPVSTKGIIERTS